MATVLKYFQAWNDSQVRPAEPPVMLPQGLQRTLLEFVAAEVERSRVELRVELDGASQANADLILECERLALTVDNVTGALEAAQAEKAALSGQLREVEAERDALRQEASAERHAAESARTETAKALLRLEAMPRLERELDGLRQELDRERDSRVSAEQLSAVAAAKLEAAQEARVAAGKAVHEAKEVEEARNIELANLRQELKEARTSMTALQTELLANVRPRMRKATRHPTPPTKG
jgi:chromosome segregation ATPase